MFLIHPIFQFVGIIIAIYVMKLGISRFMMTHLNKNTSFKWKQHVFWGSIATTIWIVGIFGGLYIVRTNWNGLLITGYHAQIGILMLPFILFAIASGAYMDRKKRKRKVLPLLHATLNTIMLMLALWQIYTGIEIYRTYVLGI